MAESDGSSVIPSSSTSVRTNYAMACNHIENGLVTMPLLIYSFFSFLVYQSIRNTFSPSGIAIPALFDF